MQILATAKYIPGDKFNFAPEGKWSVNQILSHLIAAERMSMIYIRKKIQGADSYDDTGLLEELKSMLLKVSQRLPFKFKAPGVVVQNTTLYPDLNTLITDWTRRREELRTFLEGIPDAHLTKKVYRHPRAGMLNIVHAIAFFREHSIHHFPQVKRLANR